jgi:secreted trypsin-like serine protease
MIRKLSVLSLLVVLLFVLASPAQAISYGTLDGIDHPEVGSMVARIGEDYYQWCSGTLVSENVFLTASHCTVGVDEFLSEYPGSEMLVTFDPTISSGSTYYTGQWYTNPAYLTTRSSNDPGDVAVIVLDQSPAGITPARLPTQGLLDQLKAEHLLNGTLFTTVGYGTVRDTNHKAWQSILDNVDRNQAEQSFLSLTGAWITLSMNLATGNGGTCYGDSGGPHFIHLDGVETNIVVAVTVTGDANCKATDKDYRVDTPAARDFLAGFVDLP